MQTQDPSDEWYVRAAANGDREAWSTLLGRHGVRLRRMIALRLDRRLLGRIDPSDVIQETLIDALASLPRYAERAETSFFLWLRWIAGMKLNAIHRTHLGFKVRDASREVPIVGGVWPQASSAAIAEHLLGREANASSVAMRVERQMQVQAALEALEPIDREVIALRHFEELTNAEVAGTLGIQESAASKRYLRALQRLKSHLSAKPGGLSEFQP